MIELVDIAKSGTLPVAGGSLDQAAQFMAAMRFLNSEDNRVEAERNK